MITPKCLQTFKFQCGNNYSVQNCSFVAHSSNELAKGTSSSFLSLKYGQSLTLVKRYFVPP